MKHLLFTLLLAGAALTALAQTAPRAELKQKMADHKVAKAHVVRRSQSLSERPKMLRKQDRITHRKMRKHGK